MVGQSYNGWIMQQRFLFQQVSVALAVFAASSALPLRAYASQQRTDTIFSSAGRLLLRQRDLPPHYQFVRSFVQDSVVSWDGNIRQIVTIDEQNGWLQAAQESIRDATKRPVGMSVQLFEGHAGAVRDFGQFFTNSHPETVFVPGQHWLGGSALRGVGDRATLYRIQDDFSRCPRGVTTGLSFVYANALYSVVVCTRGAGERAARDLAERLLARARQIGGR